MKLSIEQRGSITILTISGDIDAAGLAELSAAVEPRLAAGDARWILDLFALQFVSSAVLGTFLSMSKRAKAMGGDVVVARPSQFVARVISTLGVGVALRQFQGVDAAIAHLGGTGGAAAPAKRR